MRVSRPKPDRIFPEYGPWSTLGGVFSVVTLLVPWSYSTGIDLGLVVWLGCAGYGWHAARRSSRLRMVFDTNVEQVDIRRRSARAGAAAAFCGLEGIGGVGAVAPGEDEHTTYRLVHLIPTGPRAGRPPPGAFEIPDCRGPEPAVAINSWLRHHL